MRTFIKGKLITTIQTLTKMTDLFTPAKVFTKEEIEKASYNELRKMAKQAELFLGRGVTTDQYRKSLMESALKPEEIKSEEAKTSVEGYTLADLSIGDKYSIGKGKVVFLVVDSDEHGIKVSNESGQTWWERKLNKVITKKG